jgi:ABC-type multidrug transport system ATPase subunit
MRQRFGIAQALIGQPELIIVDESTAGLDPEERNRFLNLLAGIGENVVVILSTHIVDDVADLCPRMAVLAGGKLRLEGAPHDLIASTRGRVWQKTVHHTQLAEMQAQYEVISHRFFAGDIVVHVLADSQPEGFDPVSGGLEDVYFATLAETRRAPAAPVLAK